MLTAWDPVRLLDRMVDDVMRGSYGTATNPRTFAPEVDVRSSEDRIVFHFDIPGVKKEDVDITVAKGVLSVKGARRFAGAENGEQVMLGRTYGSFERSFSLPDNLDDEKLTAKLADGVLTIEIPKHQKAKPRKIEIASSNGHSNEESK